MTASRMKAIMTGLKADDDGRQLAALSELCELLSLGTEESMGALSVDSIAPLLVQQLRKEHNPDLMLLASRRPPDAPLPPANSPLTGRCAAWAG